MSPAALIASLLVGSVGLAYFMYGKKQGRVPAFVAGVALMACPYVVTDPAGMLGTGAAIGLGTWAVVRAGY